MSEENKGGVPSPAELVEERGLTKGEYGAIATGPDKKPELRRESSLLGCWLVRSCRSTTLSTVVEVGVNPANQFGNLTDSGFGNMQAAQSCGNRRSLSEGSEILKLDGQDPASVQPVEIVAARLLARPIPREYDAFTVDEVAVASSRIWQASS